MSNIIFRPVQGKEEKILALEKQEGHLYFATDTGKIYIDADGKRIPMGGSGGGSSGSSVYWGTITDPILQDQETKLYNFPVDGLTTLETVRVGDLIINADSKFYKVEEITDNYYVCSQLNISSGAGGIVTKLRPEIEIEELATYDLINGQDAKLYFTAKSAQVNGKDLASKITIKWQLSLINNSGNEEVYYKDQKTVGSGIRDFIDFGQYLRDSTASILTLQASAVNHEDSSILYVLDINTSSLELKHVQGFSYLHRYNPNEVILSCDAIGDTDKIIDFYFDNKLVKHILAKRTDPDTQSYTVPTNLCTHGAHEVRIELYQSIDGEYGLGVTPLKYEIPVVEAGNNKPIIWLGEYQDTYLNYDTIQIPYTVYDPQDTTFASVHLYKNGNEIVGSPIKVTDFEKFMQWEIADADLGQLNYYSLSCGEEDSRKVSRDILFTVKEDENRAMEIMAQDYLQLNFNPAGRSNNEAKAAREKLEFIRNGETKKAIFKNFNWVNNGWTMDDNIKQTCLRISNGAQFRIPFGDLIFASNVNTEQSNTIEIQFKVSNIQKYQNLITNITRYNYIPYNSVDNKPIKDDLLFQAYLANKSQYINYDAYLQKELKPSEYETLTYRELQKDINLDATAIQFFTPKGNGAIGIGVGPQDVFFSNGTNTVSIPFVEEDIINLSFVYNHSQRLMFIYINGCISGVIRSTESADFKISSDIIFNSNICDIDLYKLRIYNTGLTVKDICYNYAVDRKDINIWDQTALAQYVQSLDEFQVQFEGDNSITSYNKNNPKKPLMPYIIYDTTDYTDNCLPWSKQITRDIKVEFVNTPLERAYANGELVQLATDDGLITANSNDAAVQEAVKLYYKHHCPSWTSTLTPTDRVECVVQGTSSEFYPRRNFKIKTKIKEVQVWNEDENKFEEDDVLNIYMHMGPYAEDYIEDSQKVLEDAKYYGHEKSRMSDGWYMNNYTNGTDRWTMKVDYMESSGSYNAGLASLVGNAYSKHPLQDYIKAGLISNTDKLYSDIAALSKNIRWEDYRTSLLGFPVMAFQKRFVPGSEEKIEYLFIGYYRMLLDKGSDEVLGFKTDKDITSNILKDATGKPKRMRDVAECWEFSNNARTFCSFKDPWDRVQLRFEGPPGDANEFVGSGKEGGTFAPFVTDHFEYRYHWAEDYLDKLLNYAGQTPDDLTVLIEDLNKEKARTRDYKPLIAYSEGGKVAAREAAKVTLSFYENYEKLCAWIYSCNIDNVPSSGDYFLAKVGVDFNPDTTYYILENNEYVETDDRTYGQTYYIQVKETEDSDVYYQIAHIAQEQDLIYEKNKFYQKVNNAYSLVDNEEFDSNIIYYTFVQKEMSMSVADLLVVPATKYNEDDEYYTYDNNKKVNNQGPSGAVTYIGKISEDQFDATIHYVAAPVTYGNITHHYDTKEYRTSKFINELKKHFDEEYLATYFVITEILECYDSRGKNCMMASWGPQEEGGEYIWYPIFYDLDTQLGINNTGIPSFEYNVDATENNNFSTSDSVLWNNFYRYFKNSLMLNKYKHLRGLDQTKWDKLPNPPLYDEGVIESWYSYAPKINKLINIACRGERPLIVTNLDMYFKYITITNPKAKTLQVSHLDNEGKFEIDDEDTYFYALQGDRSQSRRQFVTNRLDYTDSWLNQKNYARAGSNYIKGRISSNNINKDNDVHSDKWTEDSSHPYYDPQSGKKTHDFDGEYWVTLTPTKSIYVTAGEDGANYPSKRYNGITPVKFELTGLEPGIRTSVDYPEQLVYLYGTKSMADYGDLHNLYYTEFVMQGEAPKLTRIKLGHDGLSQTDFDEFGVGKPWYNKKLNQISLKPMPLLKEMNVCNLGILTNTALDLTKSEKLENFRATGTTNLTQVQFAKGVALNTLYLPKGINSLELIEANLLTDLITDDEYTVPETLINGELKATPGLYLEGFFNEHPSSNISSINLEGGVLGYNSYRILQQYYNIAPSGGRLSMTDVNWCPFSKVTDGESYDSNYAYFIDSGHYQLDYWQNYNEDDYNLKILNNELYKIGPYHKVKEEEAFNPRYIYFNKQDDKYNLNTTITDITEDTDISTLYYVDKGQYFVDDNGFEMLYNTVEGGKDIQDLFTGLSSSSKANITGIIYIENAKNKKEQDILDGIQKAYPNVTFFFKNVERSYTAKFIIYDNDTRTYDYVKHADGSSSIPSIQRIQEIQKDTNGKVTTMFNSPFTSYKPEKMHYDFVGWSMVPNPGENDIIFREKEANDNNPWVNGYNINDQVIYPGLINEEIKDYVFYAIFTIHKYELTFYSDDGKVIDDKVYVPYGERAQAPISVPYKDPSDLPEATDIYNFIGYSLAVGGQIIDLNTVVISNDEQFYANYKKESIYNAIHEDWFDITEAGEIYPNRILKGKIIIPAKIDDVVVTGIHSSFGQKINNISQEFTHVFVELNNSINYIASGAFQYCSSLKEFDFTNTSIKYIGDHAFFNVNNLDLTTFKLNDELEYISNFGFANAFTTPAVSTEILIPSSVKGIGSRGFSNFINDPGNNIIITFNFGDGKNQSQFDIMDQGNNTPGYSIASYNDPIIRNKKSGITLKVNFKKSPKYTTNTPISDDELERLSGDTLISGGFAYPE